MSELYGAWVNKNNDFKITHKKIDDIHNEYYPFYLRRLESVKLLAEIFVEDCCESYPSIAGKININYANIIGSMGRYINDIMHYKLWHDVGIANRAKMVAHTIKWLSIYPVISVSIDKDAYASLSTDTRYFLLEINSQFIACIIGYFLEYFNNGEAPPFEKYKKAFYLIDTGQFDAKTAALMFEAIL